MKIPKLDASEFGYEIYQILVDLYTNKDSRYFLIEGINLVFEARDLNLLVASFSLDGKYNSLKLKENMYKKLYTTSSAPPLIGIAKKKPFQFAKSPTLILEDIQDPGNLGTLLRSACAFYFLNVIISPNSCNPYLPKVIRASEGAIFKVNILVTDVVDFVKTHDLVYIVTSVSSGIDICNFKAPLNPALILGNEGRGVSETLLNLVKTKVNIKMHKTESLNVAVAGSIIMHFLNSNIVV